MAEPATRIAQDLRRAAADPETRIEFELRYLEGEPPGSGFAYDLLYLDREVRRAARELRRDISREESLARRRRTRPLAVSAGLLVRESHRSDFSFLLDVPPELYELLLSDAAEFMFRVYELSLAYGGVRQLIARRRKPDAEVGEEEMLAESRNSPRIATDREGGPTRTHERIERIFLPDGTVYELVERVSYHGGAGQQRGNG